MAGPSPQQVDHYVQMFEQLKVLSPHRAESMCWQVVRPRHAPLTVGEVVSRLHGDPQAISMRRPADFRYLEDALFLEQRGDSVVIVGHSANSAEEDMLPRLSQEATVHGTFWLINNYSTLYYAAEGIVMTVVETLSPQRRWGADPEALTDHLGALLKLSAGSVPSPDWETAMATVESLTGQRLEAGWFDRPQLFATINGRRG
jgi:hypothetical protein